MTESFRIVNTRIDQEISREVPVNARSVRAPIRLHLGSSVIYRVDIVNDDGSPYLMPADASWHFGINSDFDELTAPAETLDADFNLGGDDTGATTADPTAGRLTWRVDLDTAALNTEMGTTASIEMNAELYMTPLGGDKTVLGRWPVTIDNVGITP